MVVVVVAATVMTVSGGRNSGCYGDNDSDNDYDEMW